MPQMEVVVHYEATGPGSYGPGTIRPGHTSLQLLVAGDETVKGLKTRLHKLLQLPAGRMIMLYTYDIPARLEAPT